MYRQPKDQIEPFEKLLKETFLQIKISKKQFHVAAYFNLNVLHYWICKKVQELSNIIYKKRHDTNINKPTSVTNKTATTPAHTLTNSYTETIFKTAILKCDISDHFPTCLIIPSLKFWLKNKIIYIYKRSFNEQCIFNFQFFKLIDKKLELYETHKMRTNIL